MLQGVRELGLDALPWTRDARDLQARSEFARRAAGPVQTVTIGLGGVAGTAKDIDPRRNIGVARAARPAMDQHVAIRQ